MRPVVAIPYGAWWSTPFVRWQGAFAELHALRFTAHVAKAELAARGVPADAIDFGVLGTTVPQQGAFYGAPWVLGEIGAGYAAGPTVAQACATGARVLAVAADEIARGGSEVTLALAADRVSNGPQVYYPAPGGPGGTGAHEAWVLDNFARDPFAGCAMIDTAENVAAEAGVTRQEQDALTLRRHEQYGDALARDRAFQRRYMTLPFPVPDARFRKTVAEVAGDEGVHATTREGLAGLKPLRHGGTVTHGGQTHPADGNAGVLLCAPERARELARDPEIAVEVLAFGQARAERARMPTAPIPAARRALDAAGLAIGQIAAIKTHNPFVVNDLVFARAFGIDAATMNNFGCSLVWGHPQGPTGLRSVIELAEELASRGGGYGLFTGCAAGDSAMAVVLRVGDAR